MKQAIAWRTLPDVFTGMAGALKPLEGLTYEKIGVQGAQVTPASAAGAAR